MAVSSALSSASCSGWTVHGTPCFGPRPMLESTLSNCCVPCMMVAVSTAGSVWGGAGCRSRGSHCGTSMKVVVSRRTNKPYKYRACVHGARSGRCKLCGGAQICEHLRRRSCCTLCGTGGELCEHRRRRYRCLECRILRELARQRALVRAREGAVDELSRKRDARGGQGERGDERDAREDEEERGDERDAREDEGERAAREERERDAVRRELELRLARAREEFEEELARVRERARLWY